MKTIKELNEKIWFRFLKVLYILSFILIVLISLIYFLDKWSNTFVVDFDKTILYCSDSSYKKFLSEHNNESNTKYIIDKNDFRENGTFKTNAGLNMNTFCKDIILKESNRVISDYNISGAYKIEIYKYKNKDVLFEGFIVILIEVLILILIKHLLYYIILGKFNPKN